MKLLFCLMAHFFCLSLSAKVSIRVLGVASILLEDENTKIIFDAPFTRPTISNWLGIQKFKSNEALVASVLKHHKVNSLDAVFISHSHFDHSVDAPVVASLTSAILYADKNLKKIALAYNHLSLQVAGMNNGQAIQIGHFRITPIEIQHEKVFSFDFLPGNIPDDFDFEFYDYKVGNTWMYQVEHSSSRILIAEAEKSRLRELYHFRPDIKKIDVLLQGVSRDDRKSILEGYLTILKPKIFIPTHFDNFFMSYDLHEFHHYPWTKYHQTMEWIKKRASSTKVILPKLGEVIPIH